MTDLGRFQGTAMTRIIEYQQTTWRIWALGVVALLTAIFFIFVRLVEATGPAVV